MLNIQDLYVNIGEKKILNGINLDVKPGEVHAIMGPNGSGKSTLASVLAGREEYEVQGGSVAFNGRADGHDNFAGFRLACAFDEGVEVKIGRADAFDGGYDAAKYVVETTKLLGVFDGHYVADGLDDADQCLVAPIVAADGADVLIGEVAALGAVLDVLPH